MSSDVGHCGIRCPSARSQGVQARLETVKKHLRSEESEPKYPRWVSACKRYPYPGKLATWLGIEAAKSRKQRRTLRQPERSGEQRRDHIYRESGSAWGRWMEVFLVQLPGFGLVVNGIKAASLHRIEQRPGCVRRGQFPARQRVRKRPAMQRTDPLQCPEKGIPVIFSLPIP
jgi:hypothetical protein